MHPTVCVGLFLVIMNNENRHRLSTTVTEYYVFETVAHNMFPVVCIWYLKCVWNIFTLICLFISWFRIFGSNLYAKVLKQYYSTLN